MCGICGCSDDDGVDEVHDAQAGHDHAHDHAHPHAHDHDHLHVHGHARDDTHVHGAPHSRVGQGADRRRGLAPRGDGRPRKIRMEQALLERNDRLAERNRAWMHARGVTALNLIGSPGAGKTTLLEQTVRRLGGSTPLSVVEGDQATERDALRIRATGCPVVQINTGTGCHLDAQGVFGAIERLDPPRGGVVLIENVGNLVCPSLFDLGEVAKVVVMSVTEGVDKPLKYPHVFRAARALVLTKVDLLPHLDVDLDELAHNARSVRHDLLVVPTSATRDQGIDVWCRWVHAQAQRATAPREGIGS